jgi:hypothetical protein
VQDRRQVPLPKEADLKSLGGAVQVECS